MSDFEIWAAAGFGGELIPIIPPDAELSPMSGIDPSARGKSPGRMNGQGTWGGFDWRRYQSTQRDLEWWQKSGAGIGLRTARFPALDIDAMDEELARLIEEIALRILGPAPVRIGRAPKRALAYRTNEPFGKQVLLIGRAGADPEHKVELLGDGQQYVVAGVHPTTRAPYTWSSMPRAAELTPIGPAQIEDLFLELEWILPEHGFVTQRGGAARAGVDRGGVDQEALKGDITAIAAAVTLIPNTEDMDRDAYIRMGMAIKAATADDPAGGFEVWADWAAKWPAGNDPDEIEKRWGGFKGPFLIGADWIYEQAKPFGFNAAGEEFEALEDEPSEPTEPTAPPPRSGASPERYSDSNLARHFAKMYGDEVRYVDATGRWYVWTGQLWSEDQLERARHLARDICDRASAEIQNQAKPNLNLARRVASSGTISGVQKTARADPRIAATPDLWDADPQILNTAMGVLNLRSGVLSPHDRSRYCSKMTPIGPEDMATPLWHRFLCEITRGDQELQGYLRRLAGYCLTGSTEEHALFFAHGPGGNGKGVFLNTISGILGDYATVSDMAAFTESATDRHLTELAKLHGARLVTTSETEGNRYWAEARIKRLTGGDKIAARFMRCDEFEFRPTFKLIVVGNHAPKLRNVDDAIRRRFHMIPFLFKPTVVNPRLEEELRPEWQGILRWMVAGCLEWQRTGLAPPKAVVSETAEYFASEDPIGRWLEERCEIDPQAFTRTAALFEDWLNWCAENGETAGTKIKFSRMLASRDIGKDTDKDGQRGFRLGLKMHVPEFGLWTT